MDRKIVNRRYRIERKIGEGGTAEVFLAFDTVLDRYVALKWLRAQFAAERSFRLRFEREAQASAGFNHPNIISVFDVGESRAIPYIVMEFIDGETLKTIIEDEAPFHPDDVAILIEQVAAALDYAHERGVIHRDIKPQNILVDHQGLAKVADFGLAKGLADATLTESGKGLGTVHYTSPEQASGLMATPESDIYSLSVVAFEMLTGELPFESDTAVGVAMRHVNDPPPDPSDINPEIPPEVADIVLRGLSKNPTRRYASAGDFARILTAWRSYTPEDWRGERVRDARERVETAPIDRELDKFDEIPGRRDLADDRTQAISQPAGPFDEPQKTASRPRRRWKTRLIGVVGLVLVACVLWFGLDLQNRLAGSSANDDPTATARVIVPPSTTNTPAATSTPSTVSVPNLTGLTQDQAQHALDGVGLSLLVTATTSSVETRSGSVLSQSIAAGQLVPTGSTVGVVLSSGAPAIDLTKLGLVGEPVDTAVGALTALGLQVQQVQGGSQTVPVGSVISATPSDTANPGDTVTLEVSVGDKVQIPVGLQGEPLATVQSALQNLGFVVGNTVGVDATTIEAQGVDLNQDGIDDQDVVGIQGSDAQFGGWVDRGATVTLVYYDASLPSPGTPAGG